ncbi:hypothetical protein ALTERO38_90187 [Alteromonas sp. 38]|nr:hypothetical protein ALTERO38_90187 [Alteromonas sp. 38]
MPWLGAVFLECASFFNGCSGAADNVNHLLYALRDACVKVDVADSNSIRPPCKPN